MTTQLYGIQLKDGSLHETWEGRPWLSMVNSASTSGVARLVKGKVVPVEIVISTPKRRANSAPKKGKTMAKAKVAPKKEVKKAAKRGRPVGSKKGAC